MTTVEKIREQSFNKEQVKTISVLKKSSTMFESQLKDGEKNKK